MSMDRPIDPAVEPYREIVEDWRRDLASNDAFRRAPVKKTVGPVGLTAKQKLILVFIEKFNDQHGHSPSYREIMAEFQMKSTAQAHWMVHKLEERGYIRFRRGSARSIEVVKAA